METNLGSMLVQWVWLLSELGLLLIRCFACSVCVSGHSVVLITQKLGGFPRMVYWLCKIGK